MPNHRLAMATVAALLGRNHYDEPMSNDAAGGAVWSHLIGDRPELDDYQPTYPQEGTIGD